jgi:CubicO group peptidase (beta-lactamase class C family)
MRRPLLHTVALLFSAAVLAHAADDFDFLYSRFGDYLDALRTQAGIPGLAAAIVGPNNVLWEAAYGQRDVERNDPARTNTPFQLDGTTQPIIASLVMLCAFQGELSLDARVSQFAPSSPDADATLRQLLTHTSAGPRGLTFSYRPDRLAPLAAAVASCMDGTFRRGAGSFLERFSMFDSVPGTDAADLVEPAEHFTSTEIGRYSDALRRLAVPYAVDARRRATRSTYAAPTLTPGSGLISTVHDLELFDLALKNGQLFRPDELAATWNPPVDGSGQPLPHAYGWFVQTLNGERIVWQFGVSDNASSSLLITLPRRGLTLILLANSHGLVRPFALADGDVSVSPFARLFLSLFAR